MDKLMELLQLILNFIIQLFNKKQSQQIESSEPMKSEIDTDNNVVTIGEVNITSTLDLSYQSQIPTTQNNISGNDFAKKIFNLKNQYRESMIFKEFENGNIPDFMRTFQPVKIESNGNVLIYYVSSDYLSIGDENYYLRIPMTPVTAQKVADLYNCILPTKKMVEQIYQQAVNKLTAVPKGPPYNDSMGDTVNYITNNQKIQNQLKDKDITKLSAGHKKDIILTNKLAPNNPTDKVAIFGWWDENGKIIQGVNAVSHSKDYVDYAHSVRLVSNKCLLNDEIRNIIDILQDKDLCQMLSDEGILKFLRY
jgi:hypothetical protein